MNTSNKNLRSITHKIYPQGIFNLELEIEFNEASFSDSYAAICSNHGEMFYQEKDLLDSVYEFESDSFLRIKTWDSPVNQFLSH